MHIITKFTF